MKKVIVCMLVAFMVIMTGCTRSAVTETETTTVGTITRQKAKNDLTKSNSDVLNIGYYSADKEKNPLLVTEGSLVNLLFLSYDSMFTLSAAGELENSLVETYKVLEDGRFEFTLRNGVTFHDGSPLKASDVVNSVNTIKGGGEPNQARNTIYSNVKSIIKSAEANGDRVVVMDFNDGGISPLYALTFPVVSSGGFGTGLYKIDNFGENEITFSFYDKSWKHAPNIKNIKAVRYNDEESMSKAYKANEIDAVFTDHRNIGMYKYTKNTRTMNVRTNEFYYLLPNLTSGVMSELKIRQILSYAFDKESIVSRAFDSNAIVSDFPIPSDYYIFDNELLAYSLDLGKCIRKFNELGYMQVQEGAKTYLQKDGQKFTVRILGLKEENMYHKIIAQTISSQFEEIGIVAEVNLLDSKGYADAIRNKSYDIAIANTTISGEFDLRYLLKSDGSCNYNGINIAEINSALDAIASTKNDPNKVMEEYFKVQEYMIKQLPLMGLCFVTDTFAYNDRLGNVSGAYSNYNMLSGIYQWSFESKDAYTSVQRAD